MNAIQFNLKKLLLSVAMVAIGIGALIFCGRHEWTYADISLQLLLGFTALTLIVAGAVVPFRAFSLGWFVGLLISVAAIALFFFCIT